MATPPSPRGSTSPDKKKTRENKIKAEILTDALITRGLMSHGAQWNPTLNPMLNDSSSKVRRGGDGKFYTVATGKEYKRSKLLRDGFKFYQKEVLDSYKDIFRLSQILLDAELKTNPPMVPGLMGPGAALVPLTRAVVTSFHKQVRERAKRLNQMYLLSLKQPRVNRAIDRRSAFLKPKIADRNLVDFLNAANNATGGQLKPQGNLNQFDRGVMSSNTVGVMFSGYLAKTTSPLLNDIGAIAQDLKGNPLGPSQNVPGLRTKNIDGSWFVVTPEFGNAFVNDLNDPSIVGAQPVPGGEDKRSFMPLYDLIVKTLRKTSNALAKKTSEQAAKVAKAVSDSTKRQATANNRVAGTNKTPETKTPRAVKPVTGAMQKLQAKEAYLTGLLNSPQFADVLRNTMVLKFSKFAAIIPRHLFDASKVQPQTQVTASVIAAIDYNADIKNQRKLAEKDPNMRDFFAGINAAIARGDKVDKNAVFAEQRMNAGNNPQYQLWSEVLNEGAAIKNLVGNAKSPRS